MKVETVQKIFADKKDKIFIIHTTANYKIWVERVENLTFDANAETIEFDDALNGLHQIIDVTDVDQISIRTDKFDSQKNCAVLYK